MSRRMSFKLPFPRSFTDITPSMHIAVFAFLHLVHKLNLHGIQGFMNWYGGGIIFLPWQPAELNLQLKRYGTPFSMETDPLPFPWTGALIMQGYFCLFTFFFFTKMPLHCKRPDILRFPWTGEDPNTFSITWLTSLVGCLSYVTSQIARFIGSKKLI
jgi:hypothetical protein